MFSERRLIKQITDKISFKLTQASVGPTSAGFLHCIKFTVRVFWRCCADMTLRKFCIIWRKVNNWGHDGIKSGSAEHCCWPLLTGILHSAASFMPDLLQRGLLLAVRTVQQSFRQLVEPWMKKPESTYYYYYYFVAEMETPLLWLVIYAGTSATLLDVARHAQLR